MSHPSPFTWHHFEAEIMLRCVRWYLRYALSYRDLEEMLRERGVQVGHTTISRWVQRYAPELEQRCRPHLKATTDSCGSMRRMAKSRERRCICIERWTRQGRRWSFG
jgi:transposase, IS6 family